MARVRVSVLDMERQEGSGLSVRGTVSLLLLGLLLAPLVVHASVTLPFTTTYNCAEQQQADGTWVTCDGLNSFGGWTTSLGAKEQITTAANYSGGGGGRGQRHWIHDGKNDNSGSVSYSITNAGTELYIRWYFRFQTGLGLGPTTGPHKMLYFNPCANNGGGCYFALADTTVRLTVAANNFDNGATWGFNNMMGGSTSDGNWHWVELHVKKISNTGADGIVEAWFDGVKRLDRNNVVFNSGGSDPGPLGSFDGFTLPENGEFSIAGGVDKFEDLDDVAIRSTGPIGALSGSGGTLALFLSQAFFVSTYTIQWIVMLSYLWDRRAKMIHALLSLYLLKQYYWSWRYRRAVARWQEAAPTMIEHRQSHILEQTKTGEWIMRNER